MPTKVKSPRSRPLGLIIAALTVGLVPVAVGTVPFGPQVMLTPFNSLQVVVLLLGVAGATFASLTGTTSDRRSLGSHPALLAMWALVALLLVAALAGPDPAVSLMGDGEDLNGVATYAACALLATLLVSYVRTSKEVRILTDAVVYSGAVVATISLAGQLLRIDVFGEVPVQDMPTLGWMISQGASTLGNPHFTGGFLVVPTVLSLWRLVGHPRTGRRPWMDALIAVGTTSALVMTLTRSAWLGLAAAVIAGVTLVFRSNSARLGRAAKQGFTGIALALAGVALFAGRDILRRITEVGTTDLAGLSGRSIVWSETTRMVASQPLLGTGPAAFRLGWYPARALEGLAVGAAAVATDAHSFPLMLAAIGGLAAPLLWAGSWVLTLVASGRVVWAPDAKATGDYAGWWLAAVGLSLTLLTSMTSTALLLMWAVCTGVLLSPVAKAASPAAHSRGTAMRVVTGILAVALAAVGLAQLDAHLSARSALTRSQSALDAVAARHRWSASTGLLAARISADGTIPAAKALGADAARSAIDAAFSPVASAHPEDYEVHLWWATSLMAAGDVSDDDALLEYGLERSDRAMALYPESLVMRTNRARALRDLGRLDEAASELEGRVDADPSYTDALEVLTSIEKAR